MQPVIQTHSLSRTFGSHRAVCELTFEVQPGEIFGFLGHNGAGKTTTIRLLNGILEPTEGQLSVLGYDPYTQGTLLRRRTGVLTETPSLDERMSAAENLAAFAAMYSMPRHEIGPRVGELLATFGLTERAHTRVATFSKGMKQRLALARALVHRPDLIFLDEPASGLDPVVTHQLHDLILRLSRDEGKTIFLSTHNLVEAQKLCHRVAVLQQGRLMALGTAGELAQTVFGDIRLHLEFEPSHYPHAVAALAQFTASPPTQEAHGLSIGGIRRSQIPEVIETLTHHQVRLYRVDHDAPTLEEVYLALHQEEREPV
jgi:ABC-2 type transport system ATP-binding protein